MDREITLIDRVRGPQLSTSRITVHDLVPYFQEGCSDEEILRAIPSLCPEEIRVIERFYRLNQAELDEHERRVKAHRAEQMRLQHLRFADWEASRHERLTRLKQQLRHQHPEEIGEGAGG
jgi:uncharacterized protein (DUF433 family)